MSESSHRGQTKVTLLLLVSGMEEEPREVLPPFEVVKEAKVTDEDIGDDRLGDEEWNVISSAR